MLQDRLKWNQKYKTEQLSNAPSAIVKQFFNLASGNKALDIAAGNGRNALFWPTTALRSMPLIFPMRA